ncbi:hypothetical protein ACN5L1_004122, partial [Cronobacter turicensis]
AKRTRHRKAAQNSSVGRVSVSAPAIEKALTTRPITLKKADTRSRARLFYAPNPIFCTRRRGETIHHPPRLLSG